MRSPIAAVAAALASAAGALGQSQPGTGGEGPVIVGERRETWRAISLDRVGAALDFYGEHRIDRLRQPGRPTLVDRETLLREILELSGEGSIGHKNLISLNATGHFGIEDRFIDSDTAGLSGHEFQFLNLYDARATILGEGPAPLTIYSRREQTLLDRAFAGTIDNILMETGAILRINSERAPTTLQYYHRDHEQRDRLGLFDFRSTQDTFTASSGVRLAEHQRLDLNYTFDFIGEEQQGGFESDFTRHDLNATHTLDFGENQRHQLRSNLRVLDQTGRNELRVLRLGEHLLLRHTDRLQTRYNFAAQQQSRGGEDQRLFRGDASVRHRLFESLVSSATAGGSLLDGPGDFDSRELFVLGSLDYTKRVPLGRFNTSAGASYTAQHSGARGTTLSVIEEAHTFTDPFPIILPRRRIVAGSIVVTGPGGFPTFQEGFDYTVTVFPDRAEIRPILGRGIADGQQVAVSYDVGPEPASDIDTVGTVLSARYALTEGALRGASVYTTFRSEDRDLRAGDPAAFVLEDVRTLLLGVGYVRWGFDLRAEYEMRDSNVTPSRTARFQGLYSQRLGHGSSVSADVTHEIIEQERPDNTIVFTRVGGRWNQRLGSELQANLRLDFRDQHDEIAGDSRGFDQSVGFTWHRRQTTIFGNFRNTFLDGTDTSTNTQAFEFGLRRVF